MLQRDKNTEDFIFFLYFIISIGMIIFYPFWIAIENKAYRITFFIVLLVLVIVSNFILSKKLIIYKKDDSLHKKFSFKKHKEITILVLMALLAQIIFLFLPITSYSDEISHISTGMYLEKAISYITQGYNFVLLAVFLLLIIFLFKRRIKVFDFVRKRFLIIALLLIPIAIIYFYLIWDL